MHNDLELLKLAAKAAGYVINFDEPINGYYPHGYDDFGSPVEWWNPLKDSGDALRLAVALRMNLYLDCVVDDEIGAEYRKGTFSCWASEDIGGDPLAATCRAIVRAAAEIGETL